LKGGRPVTLTWLSEFLAEPLAFPNGRYDDQVDRVSRFLAWWQNHWTRNQMTFTMPFSVSRPRNIPG